MSEVGEGLRKFFELGAGGVGIVSGFAGGIKFIGLQNTILVVVAVLFASLFYILWRIEQKVVDRFDQIESTVESGFSEVLDDENDDNMRADGGSPWTVVPGLRADSEDISGLPSFAGAAAAGLAGAVFGPQGAIAGAVLGAIAGGGVEYNNLKDRHREHLRQVAWSAFQRMSTASQFNSNMKEVRDISGKNNDYWLFQFRDNNGRNHLVRINKESGVVEYHEEMFGNQTKLGDLGR